MSVESGQEAPVELLVRVPRLRRWVTGVALGLLGGLAALLLWPAHGLDVLERPEESLERMVAREMDLRAAAATASALERPLLRFALASDAEARDDAIAWYEELVEEVSSPVAELHRIVLLAEDGQDQAVQAALAAWDPTHTEVAQLAALARAAYSPVVPAPEDLRAAIDAVRRELTPGWFADRLVARLGARLGDPAVAAAADAATLARGTRLLWRLRAILGIEALLVLLGGVALLGLLRAPGLRAARVGDAPIPPFWPFGDGVGLFARGAVGLVGVALLWPLLPDRAGSSLLIALLSAAPLLGYVLWYCRRSGVSMADTFGFVLHVSGAHGGLMRLAGVTLALVAVSTVGDFVLDFAGAFLGLGPHWTDGFQETLVWGTRGEVAVDVLDSCVLAPVLEELLFRGLLYGTFRLRFGPGSATLLSAGLFAGAHGYGVVGFASVLMSGVLWAVAYERTRSLLPGVLAHAVNNVQATAIVLATLRF
jgi:membrane protease YdiL (CAAX protease family)